MYLPVLTSPVSVFYVLQQLLKLKVVSGGLWYIFQWQSGLYGIEYEHSVAQGACMQRIQQFLKWNVKFNPNIQLNLVTSTWTDTLQLYLHTGAFALFADY